MKDMPDTELKFGELDWYHLKLLKLEQLAHQVRLVKLAGNSKAARRATAARLKILRNPVFLDIRRKVKESGRSDAELIKEKAPLPDSRKAVRDLLQRIAEDSRAGRDTNFGPSSIHRTRMLRSLRESLARSHRK